MLTNCAPVEFVNEIPHLFLQVKEVTRNGRSGHYVLKLVVKVCTSEKENVKMVRIPANVPQNPVKVSPVTKGRVQVGI